MTFYIHYGKDDEAMRPLIYCVANAFPAREVEEIEYHLRGLFDLGGAGGDPDWHIERYMSDSGSEMYWARSSTGISGLEPPCGDYDEETVKKYFSLAMREYARQHPECSAKIQELMEQYNLT